MSKTATASSDGQKIEQSQGVVVEAILGASVSGTAVRYR